MDKNLIQLRNYHLRRGKNNDSTPIYPITKPECIKGLSEYIQDNVEMNGVTPVDTLPATGEQGKVYYNTTDNKYYIYNGTDFKPFGGDVNPQIVDDLQGTIIGDDKIISGIQYTLEPNVYYDLGTAVTAFNDSLNLVVEESVDEALTYYGRFTVSSEYTTGTPNISLPAFVIIPDEQQERLNDMEASHTYEFNIFANVFMISDITATE